MSKCTEMCFLTQCFILNDIYASTWDTNTLWLQKGRVCSKQLMYKHKFKALVLVSSVNSKAKVHTLNDVYRIVFWFDIKIER